MNIDIVNKQVSKKLGVSEKEVALINKFFWRQIYDKITTYSPNPINIENVCVIYPDKWKVKKSILGVIKRIRNTRVSGRFKEGSFKKQDYLSKYEKILKKILSIRKANKWVN